MHASQQASGPGDVIVPRDIPFTFDGQKLLAREGETVAAALLNAGCRMLRRTPRLHEPRGIFCGMGVCFECLVTIDGRLNVRACRTTVKGGMRIEPQAGAGPCEEPG